MSDWNEEDLAGLTIQGPDNIGLEEVDEAAAWLAMQEREAVDSGDGASYQEELIGSSTPATLQLERIGHVEYRIQAGIKAVLSGERLEGVHPVDAAAAREQFVSEIGMDPKDFAKQIKLDEVVQAPRHPQDLKTVLSMLQNTSGEYMERGPGKTLPGNIFDEGKQLKSDEDLKTALGYVSELADLYLDGRTRGSTVELPRRQALENALTTRFLEGTFFEGSKDLLPLPNETGVTGIVRTQGIYGSVQGTAEDRLSSGKFDEFYKTTGQGIKTRFVRDESGYKVFRDEVSEAQRRDILRRTPSIANTLFPKPRTYGKQTFTAEERARQSREQKYSMEQAQFKADFARRVLREQLPTTRDESKGQMRMSGWDAPYDEQADLQNLRNEATILGMDWKDRPTEDGLSDIDLYIERTHEKIPISTGSPKQGTAAWLAQRKGKITASTAAGLLKPSGVEERALELAMERLGTKIPFTGNADTREGNEGEDKAARAFLAGPGRNLTMAEAFFEENENLPNFGVSPDGRLYDEEGESAGLLELKYLASGSMKGALAKYTPQMQMQMAVSGESQTHFYALDKFTGEYVHELVQADPNMQAELIDAGQQALNLAAGLDNRGVQALRKQIQSAKPRKKVGATEVKGQQKSFAPKEDLDEPMTAFDPGAAAVHGIYSKDGISATETTLARRLEQDDQRSRLKEAVASAQVDDTVPSSTIEARQVQERRDQAAARNAFVAGNQRPAFGDPSDGANAEMSEYYRNAQKEAADASKEASASVRSFGKAVSKAGQAMGELGGLITGGTESGMDEVRLAATTGLDVAQVRGMREELERGGLSQAGINRTISQAGGLVTTFNDEALAAAKFTDIMATRGKSNLQAVRGMALPGIQEMQGMDAQDLTVMVAGLMEGKTPEAKTQIGKMFGMPDLAASSSEPSLLGARDTQIDESGLRKTRQGIARVEQAVREAKEFAGSQGEVVGTVGAGASAASAIVGSATAGVVGGMLATKAPAIASKASTLMSKATQVGPKAANMAKTLSTAAKTTPIAIAASVAPMAIRAVGDIKDDGSVGDSAMDILEFAGYGAAVGSIVPGVGTAIGAGVGAGVGVLNEAWEYLTADDAVPSANIGNMPAPQERQVEQGKNIVNVEVTNEISPDLIGTTTNVDGDIDIDEETGIGTGDTYGYSHY